MTGSRTLVLGFDALSARYLEAFDLPNFAALRERGVAAPLESTHPPWTASAWPSLYTGTPPDHHGVYSFFDFSGGYPDDATLVTRSDVDAPALWDYLSADGVPSVVVNVPVTFPADPIEGVLVPGYLAPASAPGHPSGVRDAAGEAVGEPYRIYPDGETLAAHVDLVHHRRRVAEHLLAERDWRLAFVQVQVTDTVAHEFDDPEALRAVYRAADDLVGALTEAHADANVVVCSDHGMGPTDGYVVYVNEVLREHGLLVTADEGRPPVLESVKGQLIGGSTGGTDVERDSGRGGDSRGVRDEDCDGTDDHAQRARVVGAAAAALGAVGLTPADVYTVAERVGLDDLIDRLVPPEARTAATTGVDWAGSRAYCRSRVELGVRLNRVGREPDGVVPPGEYESVRDRVVDVLSALRTPDGVPAFDWVRPREAVYDGPHTDAAADVLFAPAGMNNLVGAKLPGRQFLSLDALNHERTGVLVAAGPDVEPDCEPGTPSVTDVTPLVMALLGRPVPERATGQVPSGLVAGPVERRDYGSVPFGEGARSGAGDDEHGAVVDRLRDMGYL